MRPPQSGFVQVRLWEVEPQRLRKCEQESRKLLEIGAKRNFPLEKVSTL
jgi:hypothetical protein